MPGNNFPPQHSASERLSKSQIDALDPNAPLRHQSISLPLLVGLSDTKPFLFVVLFGGVRFGFWSCSFRAGVFFVTDEVATAGVLETRGSLLAFVATISTAAVVAVAKAIKWASSASASSAHSVTVEGSGGSTSVFAFLIADLASAVGASTDNPGGSESLCFIVAFSSVSSSLLDLFSVSPLASSSSASSACSPPSPLRGRPPPSRSPLRSASTSYTIAARPTLAR